MSSFADQVVTNPSLVSPTPGHPDAAADDIRPDHRLPAGPGRLLPDGPARAAGTTTLQQDAATEDLTGTMPGLHY